MDWNTAITRLLGCKYPIMQGAYAGLGTWEFAAAAAKTGVHGTITASTSRTPEKLREDIRRCRETVADSGGCFGVNLTYASMSEEVMNQLLEVCIEEQVPVETASYKPDNVARRIKGTGIPWIHKTARIRDAIHAEKLGADAVIMVGLEGVGFKNPEQLPLLITITWGIRQLNIPLIAAGGIGDARGLLGALAMGAEGIMMGTAFMATRECRMNDAAKQRMVALKPDDAEVSYRILSKPNPDEYAEVMKLRSELPLEKWLRLVHKATMRDSNWRQIIDAPESTMPTRITSSLGSLAVGFIDDVPTCQELIDKIIGDAESIRRNSWLFTDG